MNATLNIGQTIGDFCVEEFVKASDENGGETYFVRWQRTSQNALAPG